MMDGTIHSQHEAERRTCEQCQAREDQLMHMVMMPVAIALQHLEQTDLPAHRAFLLALDVALQAIEDARATKKAEGV